MELLQKMSLIISLMFELKNSYQKKENKYLHELFEKWDPEHLQLDEDFDDYLENDGPENIIGDEGMQNLNMDDQPCQQLKALKSYCTIIVLFCSMSGQ